MELKKFKLTPLMKGALAFLGALVIIGIATMLSRPSIETRKNVRVDLPGGGNAVISEIRGEGRGILLSGIDLDISGVPGSVESIFLEGLRSDDLKKIKNIPHLKITNLDMSGVRIRSLVYEDLNLDFALLASMDGRNTDSEDVKKLLESFHLKKYEIKGFTFRQPGFFLSFNDAGASDCSAGHAEDFFVDGVKGEASGVSFSIEKFGLKILDLKSIVMQAFSPDVLNRPRHSPLFTRPEEVFNGVEIKDFFVKKFDARTPVGHFDLEKLVFDLEAKKRSGDAALEIRSLEIPDGALALLGLANIRGGEGNLRVNGDMSCGFRAESDVLSLDPKVKVRADDFVAIDYTAQTRINMKNPRVVNEKAEFVLKDKGMVKNLTPQTKMLLWREGMGVDPAVGQGIESFLERPGKTLTVRVREKNSGSDITVDVD